MATGLSTQKETKCFKMDINLSEYSRSKEDSITKAECTEHVSEISKGDTTESERDEDTGEKTGQTKKRYRSEKQRERTRQYKKKIRRAKKQMMREKKLAERNSNGGHMTGDSLSFKPQGPESGTSSTRLLQTSGNKIEPERTGEHKNPLVQNPAEQVSLQRRHAVNLRTEAQIDADRYEDKIPDNMKDDSLSLKPQAPQTGCATAQLLQHTEDKIASENIGVDKKLSKENLTETVSVQLSPIINHTTQAAVDAHIHENIIPDKNTKEDSLSVKLQEFETGCAKAALLSLSEDIIELQNTGMDNNHSRETLVVLRPAVNITTEAAVDESRDKVLILDENKGDKQDIFGIFSIYVDSGIHYGYAKDCMVKTSPANDFGYVYFSMKDFWK